MGINMLTKQFYKKRDCSNISYVDYICGWNQYVMKILGIWPEERKINKVSSYVVLISISIMVLIITIPLTIQLFIIWGDFSMVVENLSIGNITVMIAVIKTTAFWSNGRSNYRSNNRSKFFLFLYSIQTLSIVLINFCFWLINFITEALKNLLLHMEENRKEAKSREEVRRMMTTAKLCRTLSTGSISFILIILVTSITVRIWMNRYTGRMLLVTIYSPYDYLISPNYEITLASQLFAGGCSCLNYTMVDLFLATLVFHTCGQVAILKARIHRLDSKGKYEFQAELADIIKKHNSLCDFVETIENLFNCMLLIQMFGCTILLCIQSFQAIVTVTGESLEITLPQMFFFGFYITYILVQLYLYCYIGEKLHSESISITDAAYECKWYDLSPNEARSVILVMVRAHTPLRLTAGKLFWLNHELFKSILKTSMSYLSVLYAMKISDAN